MHTPRVWLITGSSSGLGKALTEVVLRKGDIVVATLRKPAVLAPLAKLYPPSQLLLLTLDVTRPSDITAAFARTREVFGRLDVVFNNAGCAIFSEVEGTPDPDARALFDVNFWGLVDVSREAVKFFREVNPRGKGGILLQNSSMMGFIAVPGTSFYCASKHAIDGFSESLSRELLPEWNIKVSLAQVNSPRFPYGSLIHDEICTLQPGWFDTNIIHGQICPAHPAYINSATAALRNVYLNMKPDGDPYKFAETLYRLVASTDDGKERIPLYLPIGKDALSKLQGRLKMMNKVLVDAVPWSADLKKDHDEVMAKL